jgi:hypothetical protein
MSLINLVVIRIHQCPWELEAYSEACDAPEFPFWELSKSKFSPRNGSRS